MVREAWRAALQSLGWRGVGHTLATERTHSAVLSVNTEARYNYPESTW